MFFIQSRRIAGTTLTIDPPLRAHLADSLRVRRGECLWVADEHRIRYRVRIDRLDARAMQASILDTVHAPPPPQAPVLLAQAVLKGDRMRWVMQKAAELGVDAIVPLLTARVIARPPAQRIRSIRERWQRIATDAAEQSEQWSPPRVDAPMTLPALCDHVGGAALRCALIERDAPRAFHSIPLDHTTRGTIVLAVGPEGGWTEEETRMFAERRFHGVSLGDGILRSETATLAALSILRYRLGEVG